MATAAHQIAWTHDFDRALQDANAKNLRVLIDFSAAPM
jgi:hypothetical protein